MEGPHSQQSHNSRAGGRPRPERRVRQAPRAPRSGRREMGGMPGRLNKARGFRFHDQAAAHDDVPVVEDAGLAGRDRPRPGRRRRTRAPVARLRMDRRGRLGARGAERARRARKGPDGVRPRGSGACRRAPREWRELGCRSHDDAVGRGIHREDVEALGAATPMPRRCPTVNRKCPAWVPRSPARRVFDRARARREGDPANFAASRATKSPARAPGGTKQISWLSSLSARWEARRGGRCARTSPLDRSPDRKPRRRELLGRQVVEKVGLVLGGIACP